MTISSLFMLLLIAIAILVVLYFRFYQRASKEVAFVRTGFGGEKIVMGGGALVIPILQETTSVNLNTLRLTVKLANSDAVVSKDRMRVNIEADFYVHVPVDAQTISIAAATLGARTLREDAVRDIVEGKFIDTIRSVVAQFSMEELHEARKAFALKVRDSLSEELVRNGLALESVSVTALDQTDMEYFNPSNAFDAEGLTLLTETIEQRKKKRNDIEQDTQLQIKNKNLKSEIQRLSMEREGQFARLEQELDIERRKAEQTSEIARSRAEHAQTADEADIEKNRKIEIAKILSEREIDEERIDRDRALKERDIEKNKIIMLTEQQGNIAISKGSIAEMESKSTAEKTRASLVSAEEKVMTVQEQEIAERRKAVAIIEAARGAECEAVAMTLLAAAKRQAATDKAQANLIKAKADDICYKTDAEGERLLNEAKNLLSSDQITADLRKYLIDHLPQIIRESSEPLKNIDSIRVVQTSGLAGSDNKSASNDIFDGALRYRAQAPIVDALLKELDLGPEGDLNDDFGKRVTE